MTYSSAPQEATVALGLGADAVIDKRTDPEALLGQVVQMCHAREQD